MVIFLGKKFRVCIKVRNPRVHPNLWIDFEAFMDCSKKLLQAFKNRQTMRMMCIMVLYVTLIEFHKIDTHGKGLQQGTGAVLSCPTELVG